MFTPSTHPYVGTEKTYLPDGSSPYQPVRVERAVLYSGDRVTVLSAWERDYLPGAVKLLYVLSHNTGQFTHVTQADLKAL